MSCRYVLYENIIIHESGAVGAIGAPVAAAELEGGDEPGLVTVDSPTAPTNDVQALLHQVGLFNTDCFLYFYYKNTKFCLKYD